jgi:hypothetical protein
MIPSIRVAALASLLAILPAQTAFAESADLPSVYVHKSSRNPIIIRCQLELAVVFARLGLRQLRTATATETTETLGESYKLLRLAHEGIRLKQAAEKHVGVANPLLLTADEHVGQALAHIRNAWQLSPSLSPSRPHVIQDVADRLEAMILLAQQAEDLV